MYGRKKRDLSEGSQGKSKVLQMERKKMLDDTESEKESDEEVIEEVDTFELQQLAPRNKINVARILRREKINH